MNDHQSQMKPDPKREAALFQAAAQLTGGARASFLDNACAGDAPLRRRLENLLAAHEQKDGVLAEPESSRPAGTVKLQFTEIPDETVGQKIGRYKILEKVGEGGCGVVYVAEQTEPVRRRVALKVIKLGMDTKAVVARFEAERQALAMMDHPNIAKVLDAGTTETGRPYFIMELVRGIRITDYCDQNRMATRERLELFIKICQAIQHAHQKGIIHRDIKPSNILVTLHDGVPVPKVIDFGIAKATEGRLTDATVYTQLHQFIGTPAYMSPEQAEMSGLDIDTRSDIYSLGVLLYELLTGRTPFDAKELMASGIDAMRKTIREKEPVRPSTRLRTLQGEELSTTAARHAIEAPRLITLLRGDLDWIVMKCLEKDRTRRYETANGLAMDIKRHLTNEPVAARPPSKLYEFQKTVRRHKTGFAAAAAIILILAGGVLISTWQAVRATRATHEALVARQQAEANAQKALAAQTDEARLRKQAQDDELAARQRAYASDMNAAVQALDGNNRGQALDLLNRQRPGPGQKDLRGWEWRYLWKQTRSDALFTLCQKSGEIESLAASSDGGLLAVGNYHAGGLSVWDLRTRQEVAHLAQDDRAVRAAFSPFGSLLAFTSAGETRTGRTQHTLHFWNIATRQMTVELPLDGVCDNLAFSTNGRTLVTSTVGGRMTFWRVSDGTKLAGFPSADDPTGPATCFAVSSDLTLAAYGCGLANRPQRVGVFDLVAGKELWTAPASPAYVMTVALSPDGRILASTDGFDSSDIFLWDAITGTKIGQLEGHTSWVGALVFWPDGTKVASASADQTIRIWDVASRQCLDVLHGSREELWRLALLPDNRTLVSGAKNGTICLWDTSVPHPRHENITWPVKVRAWNFASDNHSIVTLDANGDVARWTGDDFQEKIPLFNAGRNMVNDFPYNYCFSKDGRFLAFRSNNGGISIWDVPRQTLLRQLRQPGDYLPTSFVAGGDKLLTLSLSHAPSQEWDVTTGVKAQTWPGPAAFIGAFALSPDEQLSVSIGYEGDVFARNLADDTNLKLPLDALEASGAAFSPDNRYFAIASALGHARVWDTRNWKETVTLRGFLLATQSVAFSPDGDRLATFGGAATQALRLWDMESWQNVITLQGTGSIFYTPLYSPDGSSVGAISTSGILNVWRAPSWEEIAAAEAKDPPSPDYNEQVKAEIKQP
jgi:eukaryotic-like serine/threonine-protein kinase